MATVDYTPRRRESESMAKITTLFAVVVAVQAAGGAALPQSRVFDDVRMISVCVIGATIGAFLAIAVFPVREGTDANKTQRLSLKFGSSMLAGIVFTPSIMHWFELDLNADYLMATAAIVAVFAVSILHMVAPRVEKIVSAILDARGNGK